MELGQSLAVPFLLFNIYNKFIKGNQWQYKEQSIQCKQLFGMMVV
jgi:hypothetical protein